MSNSPRVKRRTHRTQITSNPISVDYDFRREKIEVWPSSASTLPSMTTNKSVAFLKTKPDSKQIMKNLMSNINKSNKPLLLLKMQQFIQHELSQRVNQCMDPDQINESRLDVFRECFDAFIDEFPTYQPVLIQIKNEYEKVIDQCLRKVHDVINLETKLNTARRKHKDDIKRLKEDHQHELEQRESKLNELYAYINAMKVKHEDIDNLLSKSEQEQKRLNDKLSDTQRSARTFYNEIKKVKNDMAYQETLKVSAEAELRKLQIENRKMSIAHQSVVADLKRLQEELDAAPQLSAAEIQEKDKQIKSYHDKLNEYKQLYESLMDDHQNVLDLYDKVTKERQQQAQKYAEMMQQHEDGNRPVTPRPNWQKAVELKFMSQDIIEGKSTDDIMAFMITKLHQLEKKVEMLQSIVPDDELQELQIKDDSMYMDVSYDSTTPKYLRYKGKIRKRRIPKRDLEILLKAIWKKKYSMKSSEKMILSDYLYDYFKCEYGIQSRIVETGYAMLAALERYKYDADCELFLTILNGELSEDVYRDQFQFVNNLYSELQAAQRKRNNDGHVLSKSNIKSIIRKLCPAKNEQNMKQLLNALDLNDPHDMVRYELLFKEDRDGNQGPFMEELRDQHLGEIQDFLKEIKTNLELVQNEYQQVTVEQIEGIIKKLDPMKPQSEVNKYLCVGFGVSMIQSLAKNLLISCDIYYKKLSGILVKRSGLQMALSRRNLDDINDSMKANLRSIVGFMKKQVINSKT